MIKGKAFIAIGTVSNEDPAGQKTITVKNAIYLKIKNIGGNAILLKDQSALNFNLPAGETVEFYFKDQFFDILI